MDVQESLDGRSGNGEFLMRLCLVFIATVLGSCAGVPEPLSLDFFAPADGVITELSTDDGLVIRLRTINRSIEAVTVEEIVALPAQQSDSAEPFTTQRRYRIVVDAATVFREDASSRLVLVSGPLSGDRTWYSKILSVSAVNASNHPASCTIARIGPISVLEHEVSSFTTRCFGRTGDIVVAVETTFAYGLGMTKQETTVTSENGDKWESQILQLTALHPVAD